ncbi:PLD nuclease N-terminal domain-containing protein [Candidatus Xianfuyuplasma coldseepsis]|uniref:PLDc_N domain-containing protein n=1 Tax=Candidatus Xianfuyuplasma coldseepsis TaxID=2782163 RepID=A0A7L7KRF0_9MOLU|nr:PLD nuclease N-terminal domain-containing protein [Xianfuyuplasma coldseepsis]QMS84852.1 PLDc_N domain-containing protein [Xianfuyuplasma coldseepsis]
MLEQLQELLPLLIPIVLIDIGFRIFAIIDIVKQERQVKGNNKIVWILIVGLVSYFGWIIYFLIGRDD